MCYRKNNIHFCGQTKRDKGKKKAGSKKKKNRGENSLKKNTWNIHTKKNYFNCEKYKIYWRKTAKKNTDLTMGAECLWNDFPCTWKSFEFCDFKRKVFSIQVTQEG